MNAQGRPVAFAVAPIRSWPLAVRARRCGATVLVAICAQWLAGPVHAGPTEPARDSISVAPGAGYDAGWFYRIFWGDHWREAWTTEIRVPVLGAVLVTLRDSEPGSEPYLRRRFLRGETEEIRLYLWGGDDRVGRLSHGLRRRRLDRDPWNTRSILSVAFAASEEESGLYVTMGFAY